MIVYITRYHNITMTTTDVINSISELLESKYSLVMKTSPCREGVIDLRLVKDRRDGIAQIEKLANFLEKITPTVIQKLAEMRQEDHLITKNMVELIDTAIQVPSAVANNTQITTQNTTSNTDISDETAWTKVVKNGIQRPRTSTQIIQSPISHVMRVQIVDNIYVMAHQITDLNGVRDDGTLYYLPAKDVFAIRFCGYVLRGNIGEIFINALTPTKIKKCKYDKNCSRVKCDYYHDPISYPGSRDHRNFIASSWLYTPMSRSRNDGSSLHRVFGSRSTLSSDIFGLTKESVETFGDQLMHDLLCYIVARGFLPQ